MHQSSAIPRCAQEEIRPAGMTVVAGDPVQIRDRELVPLVGVSSYLRRRAFVGMAREGACSRGVHHLRPVGVVVRRAGRERTIPIHDLTSRILALLTIAGLLIPVALAVAGTLARIRRRTPAVARAPGSEEVR